MSFLLLQASIFEKIWPLPLTGKVPGSAQNRVSVLHLRAEA
ncbi:hypothetical protein [Pannonibacter phragmitetus]|nr:hypothetical protein [Pannonibacter phragmitetus]